MTQQKKPNCTIATFSVIRKAAITCLIWFHRKKWSVVWYGILNIPYKKINFFRLRTLILLWSNASTLLFLSQWMAGAGSPEATQWSMDWRTFTSRRVQRFHFEFRFHWNGTNALLNFLVTVLKLHKLTNSPTPTTVHAIVNPIIFYLF